MTAIDISDVTSNVVTSTDGKYTVTGDGVLDDLMETVNAHIIAHYDAGRITSKQFAETYIGIVPSVIQQATAFVLNQQIVERQGLNLEKQGLNLDKDAQLKDEQVFTAQRKLSEDDEKWDISKGMMENQKATSDIDLGFKPSMAAADLSQKELMLESAEADIAFNDSKRVVMEQTRKDNVRMKATEQYAEFLKYISAAGAVPGEHHFENLVGLIEAINSGVLTDDDIYDMYYLGEQRRDRDTGDLLYWTGTVGTLPLTTDVNGGTNPPAYYENDTTAAP